MTGDFDLIVSTFNSALAGLGVLFSIYSASKREHQIEMEPTLREKTFPAALILIFFSIGTVTPHRIPLVLLSLRLVSLLVVLSFNLYNCPRVKEY